MSELRKHFDLSLKELKEETLKMFQDIHRTYDNLFYIIETKDIQMANQLIDDDALINKREITINDMGYLIIVRQCPVATDLRRIMIAIKIANDLERIADYAANIATYITKTKYDNSFYLNAMKTFKEPLLEMLEVLEEAFKHEDTKQAFNVCEMDNQIDELYTNHVKEFIRVTKEKIDIEAEEASRGIIVVKQFERAGDHLTNIAEEIIFLQSGKHLELN
ncbi:MAG: phosphate signaling complex protein PhoU [Candidatus Izemoplasmataceae bacterium]